MSLILPRNMLDRIRQFVLMTSFLLLHELSGVEQDVVVKYKTFDKSYKHRNLGTLYHVSFYVSLTQAVFEIFAHKCHTKIFINIYLKNVYKIFHFFNLPHGLFLTCVHPYENSYLLMF